MPVTGDGVRRWHADLAWLPTGGVRPGKSFARMAKASFSLNQI